MKYVIVKDIATGKHHLRFSDLPVEPHLQEVGAEYSLGMARRRVDLLNHPELAPLSSKVIDRLVRRGMPFQLEVIWNALWFKKQQHQERPSQEQE